MPTSNKARWISLEQTLKNSAIKNTAIKVIGLLLTILGLIVFALPLPLGIPLTAIGLMMLISTSRTARRVVRYLRMKSTMVDRLFTLVETKVPGPTQKVLRKTRRRSVGRSAVRPATDQANSREVCGLTESDQPL